MGTEFSEVHTTLGDNARVLNVNVVVIDVKAIIVVSHVVVSFLYPDRRGSSLPLY